MFNNKYSQKNISQLVRQFEEFPVFQNDLKGSLPSVEEFEAKLLGDNEINE